MSFIQILEKMTLITMIKDIYITEFMSVAKSSLRTCASIDKAMENKFASRTYVFHRQFSYSYDTAYFVATND